MKTWIAILLFLSIPGAGLKTISRINDYADRAAKAYEQEKYAEAITAYEYLLEDLEVQDDQLSLNLAHAYFKAGLMTEAQNQYRLLADHASDHIRSIVNLQLGNIAADGKKYAHALALYRNALIANPENEVARYNYELLKKYLILHPEKAEQPKQEPETPHNEELDEQMPPSSDEEQEPQPKQKPDANGTNEEEIDQPQPDPAGQEQNQGGKGNQSQQKDKEQAAGNEKGNIEGQQLNNQFDPDQQNKRGSTENAAADDSHAQTQAERQQVKISAEKARVLLNAMRDAELQYLQQLPKKAIRKKDKSKPDW
ncbi:aerotolerance protein [Pontibacter sp. KCTC 32443]|uniref:aerotolerance protein n=1 Tax=Pontibacter TaxID=323449 RepID=UPI00164E0765|nr:MULTISPECIES: aerotolerance protein [Pontibacter]MBC5772617.1 aerotolerance protein [Pontibacter sp. KCTC 32443]